MASPRGAFPLLPLSLALLGLWGSGALWLFLHFARPEESLPGSLEAFCLKLHGGLALVALFLLGAILDSHILEGLRSGRNRPTGVLLAGGLLLLALSGYGLYYFDGDLLRGATTWIHRVVGALCLPLLGWHIHRGRRGDPGDAPG